MKKVIDGKRYDTGTATLVAHADYGNRSDFYFWDEDLYITKKGNWFIYGEGGPRSQYAVQVEQNQWSGGEGIISFTADEAMDWLEKYDKIDELEKHFADQIEDA